MRLAGKTAVITGASSGIGRASAILFAVEGARVVCVDVDERGGEQTIELIRERGREALFVRADVSNYEQVQHMADECTRVLDRVDVLFNNAGRTIWRCFEDTDVETWSRMIGINLTGTFLCSRYLLPLMKRAGAGSIINNASIDGFLGNPHIAAYAAAKGGLIPLTHVMAHDLAKYNIRVNCLCTGGIASGMTGHVPPEMAKKVTALVPLGRMGTPEEVAKTALFFATDESSYVTAAALVVDGGRTSITQGCF